MPHTVTWVATVQKACICDTHLAARRSPDMALSYCLSLLCTTLVKLSYRHACRDGGRARACMHWGQSARPIAISGARMQTRMGARLI